MKTKKRRQSRKKRVGGASGLVLIVDYDKSGNIKNMKLQNMLARHEYMNRNKIDPSPNISDGFRELFNLDRMQQAFRDFLNLPGDESISAKRKTQKKRIVKIAVNDKSDITLIQLVNKVINRLNGIKNKRSQQQLFIIRDTAGKLTNKTQLEFRKRYEELLAGAFIEDYKNEKKTDVDEELLKRLMRMPVLMNVVSIKYGLLNRGDMKLEELQDIYNLDNGRILELVKVEKKARPNVVTYDQIIEEENEKLAKENLDLQEKLNALKANKAPEPELVVLEELGEKPIEELGALSAAATSTLTPARTSTTATSTLTPTLTSAGPPDGTPIVSSNVGPNLIPVAPPDGTPIVSSNVGPNLNPVATSSATSAAANAPGHSQKLDMANPRVKAIKQFNDLLLTKYGGSRDKINQNTTDFLNELKTTQSDPVKLMQYYLIKNILVCIRIDETNLFTNSNNLKNDSSEFQSIILTLIRIFLSHDMRNYERFKKTFDNNTKTTTICDSATQAANSLSTLGSVRGNFSYDTIIQNIIDTDIACTDYEKIITIHLNKLYDLFETKEVLYIRRMVSKSNGNTLNKSSNYYDETYEPNNANYIFS